jgi:hypothetical protein
MQLQTINIQPESDVYVTYRRLSYELWNAIAEYVDNSTQSFSTNRDAISIAEGKEATLSIQIFYDPDNDTLLIADNANGMDFAELSRAIQLNKPPEDRSGRSEFGMGLKMASCWLGSRWRVVTKKLDALEELTAELDIDTLVAEKSPSIVVSVKPVNDPSAHYTRIEIEGLYRKFRTRTISKVTENLASIYRRDIESGLVSIEWNTKRLSWEPDPVYETTDPDGNAVRYEKTVSFEIKGLPVKGRVWIRVPGDAKRAGLHIFRRGRLIMGGPGKGYKPEEIFEAVNQFPSQRIVGEIDLDDWPVSMTKDAIDWTGELEHEFIVHMKDAIQDYVDISKQVKRDKETGAYRDTKLVADASASSMKGEEVETALIVIEEAPLPGLPPITLDSEAVKQLTQGAPDPVIVPVGTHSNPVLKVWFLNTLPESELYAKYSCPNDRELHLVVNMNHPFIVKFFGTDTLLLQIWAQLLYVEALVERSLIKRGPTAPVTAFRQLKDGMLRHLNG